MLSIVLRNKISFQYECLWNNTQDNFTVQYKIASPKIQVIGMARFYNQ